MGFLDNLGSFFLGNQGGVQQAQNFTPYQQQALNSSLGQARQGLSNSSFNFAPIAQQARNQFQNQTIPSILERFSGLGSGGAQRSSAFGQLLGSAGSDLESQLAAMQQQYNLQNNDQLLKLLGIGLTPQYENFYMQRQPGFLENFLVSGSQGLGKAGGMLLGKHFGL